jgi:hypothetical protein
MAYFVEDEGRRHCRGTRRMARSSERASYRLGGRGDMEIF